MDVEDKDFVKKYINKNYKELFDIDIATWVDSLIDETNITTTKQALDRVTSVVKTGKLRITQDLSGKLNFKQSEVLDVVNEYFEPIDKDINDYIKKL